MDAGSYFSFSRFPLKLPAFCLFLLQFLHPWNICDWYFLRSSIFKGHLLPQEVAHSLTMTGVHLPIYDVLYWSLYMPMLSWNKPFSVGFYLVRSCGSHGHDKAPSAVTISVVFYMRKMWKLVRSVLRLQDVSNYAAQTRALSFARLWIDLLSWIPTE